MITHSAKHRWITLGSIALMALTAACGKKLEGKYQGTESAIVLGGNKMSQMARLEIRENGSEFITGTWTSQSASGTFQGRMKEDRIEGLELTRNAASAAASGTTQTSTLLVSYGSEPCIGRYTGTIKVADDRISGRLEQSQGWGLYTPGSSYMSSCSALEIDVSRLND
jgi:hypothetical protein